MYDNYDKFVKSKNNTINSTIFVNNIIKITEKYRRNLTTKDFQEIFRLYSNLDLDEVTFLRVLPEFLEIRDSISGGILGLDLFKILLDNLSKTYNTIYIEILQTLCMLMLRRILIRRLKMRKSLYSLKKIL